MAATAASRSASARRTAVSASASRSLACLNRVIASMTQANQPGLTVSGDRTPWVSECGHHFWEFWNRRQSPRLLVEKVSQDLRLVALNPFWVQ